MESMLGETSVFLKNLANNKFHPPMKLTSYFKTSMKNSVIKMVTSVDEVTAEAFVS